MPEPEPQSTDPSPQPQSSSPPDVSEVFRESFLTFFERPEHQAAVRLLAPLAYTLICESRDHVDTPDSDVWQQTIRGSVGDLRQAANQLKEAARDLDEAGGGGRHVVRAMLAISDAFTEVEPIAARLDAALIAYLATPEPEE